MKSNKYVFWKKTDSVMKKNYQRQFRVSKLEQIGAFFLSHSVGCTWAPEKLGFDGLEESAVCRQHAMKATVTFRLKPKFHWVRHVTSRLDKTRHVRRVELIHFDCLQLVEKQRSTRSSRRARHVERGVSRRDVTWRAKWNLGFISLTQSPEAS